MFFNDMEVMSLGQEPTEVIWCPCQYIILEDDNIARLYSGGC